jgi:hypothetical protein
VAQAGHASVYVEIMAKAGQRVYVPRAEDAHDESQGQGDLDHNQ